MEEIIQQNWQVIAAVIVVIFKNKIFVTPAQMSAMKDSIIAEVKHEYATKEMVESIKDSIDDIREDVKSISNYILNHKVD